MCVYRNGRSVEVGVVDAVSQKEGHSDENKITSKYKFLSVIWFSLQNGS
jgi:hypothetical protein